MHQAAGQLRVGRDRVEHIARVHSPRVPTPCDTSSFSSGGWLDQAVFFRRARVPGGSAPLAPTQMRGSFEPGGCVVGGRSAATRWSSGVALAADRRADRMRVELEAVGERHGQRRPGRLATGQGAAAARIHHHDQSQRSAAAGCRQGSVERGRCGRVDRRHDPARRHRPHHEVLRRGQHVLGDA